MSAVIISDEQIGKNVASARGEMSQKELARLMRERGWKWSQATVWSIEKGERPLRVAEAEDLGWILNVGFTGFTSPDAVATVMVWARRAMEAHNALGAAAIELLDVQVNLAVAADSAADVLTGHARLSAESWLSSTPAEVVTEAVMRKELETDELAYLDRFRSQEDLAADDRDIAESRAHNGPFLTRYAEIWARIREEDARQHGIEPDPTGG